MATSYFTFGAIYILIFYLVFFSINTSFLYYSCIHSSYFELIVKYYEGLAYWNYYDNKN